jgi:glutamate racemase
MVGVPAEGVALPDLVPLIEHNGSREEMSAMVRTALAGYRGDCTHVVLGCTHFPLVRDVFAEVLAELGLHATLVDPADAVADAVMARFTTHGTGHTDLMVSAESPAFSVFARGGGEDAVSVRVL